LLILLSACHMQKEADSNNIHKLQNLWTLSSMADEDLDLNDVSKLPTLKIDVADMRVSGNDGCNNIMGSIETLTATEFKFGMLAGTKMMCQDMEVPRKLGQRLPEVRTYMLTPLKLHFYDADGNELLTYKKVDK
ncbi:MAG: META domain-containing protein, partial [Bacteroidia bacterium]